MPTTSIPLAKRTRILRLPRGAQVAGDAPDALLSLAPSPPSLAAHHHLHTAMVSANSLNLDVVEQICAHISANDILAVLLVNRSFFAGAIPRLYRTLIIRRKQGKRFPAVQTPFTALLAHPELSVHVRTIEIRVVPEYKGSAHSEFMRDCALALRICRNLSTFTCTTKELPAFLLALAAPAQLDDVRIQANLTRAQAETLLRMTHLRNLTLDAPSWTVVDLLPRWAAAARNTLTRLSLFMAPDLNETILDAALPLLPHLTGLHIINCAKVDHVAVLRLAAHTPLLESLAFTTWESPRSLGALPAPPPPLPHLRHIALDTHCSLSPGATPGLWAEIFARVAEWRCALRSVTFRMTTQLAVGDEFLHEFLLASGQELVSMTFVNCGVSIESVRSMCVHAPKLEKLAVPVPVKEFLAFKGALCQSDTLHTLFDMDDSHHRHGQRASLSRSEVHELMQDVPKLRRYVADSRQWTGEDLPNGDVRLSLERRKISTTTHWFLPPR